jgi:predicted esterase
MANESMRTEGTGAVSAIPPAVPTPPEVEEVPVPEQAIRWIADAVGQGLTRVYALTVEERAGDSDRLQAIDLVLQQAKALGRRESIVHATCTRFGHEVVMLVDDDPHFDWLLPAVRKRLREELAPVGFELDPAKTQILDLARGDELRFLGFKVRSTKDRHGTVKVQYHRIEEDRGAPDTAEEPRCSLVHRLGSRYLPWLVSGLESAGRFLTWIGVRRCGQFVRDVWRRAGAIEFGWRHLPLTVWPVVALAFGWQSPVAVLCAVLIVLCNWRKTLELIRSAGTLAARRPRDVTLAACAVAACVCLVLLVSDFRANHSREDPVGRLAPGFYLGQYRPSWGSEPVPYGLYVPPHFRKEKGPFPLIVFLHGYGERTKAAVFSAGLPRVINSRFGDPLSGGRFDFVAFFPIVRKGVWFDVSEVQGAIRALDYVMERHRVDPERVYLTGLSNGGSGVWYWAADYPDKWAALAPVSAFTTPDVPKVRHLPAWIFHGAKDKEAPVERARAAVRQLKEAKADVRYTEVPDKGHLISREAYDSDELYQWFAARTRKHASVP